MNNGRHATAVQVAAKYAATLTCAQLTGAIAVSFAVLSVVGHTSGDVRPLLAQRNLIALRGFVPLAAIVGAAATLAIVRPSFRWFTDGREPTEAEQRAAVRIAHRQSAVQFAIWTVSAVVFALVNLDAGATISCLAALVILFGAVMTSCISFLVSQRTLRPITAAALKSTAANAPMPGVLARSIVIWALFSALPSTAIASIVLARSPGWLGGYGQPVATLVLVLTVMSLLFGFPATGLVARSVSDPLHDVVMAMKEVRNGRLDVSVNVYEPSEVGLLQSGFNRMVAGLAERDRLRDLFGRHVGTDVARRALEQDSPFSGEVCEVGVLFVDLVGSTEMASSRAPQEIAQILNEFFRLVVSVVDSRKGLINKFAGDAALVVFGAPLRLDQPASSALATARVLAERLREMPAIDFGVGVSAGLVFAGNIGAENRYEYTVIGDPVNEAARIADYAKGRPNRVVSSGSALAQAGRVEQEHWTMQSSAVLRGRSAVTQLAEPQSAD